MTRAVRGSAAFFLVALLLWAADRKKDKEVHQTLEAVPEPPLVVTVAPQRLSFHVAPLSGKGLLSPQVRESWKNLQKQVRGALIVKVRAYVAGTGDLRRVQTIIAEECQAHHAPLPVMTVLQVGALPLEGAQVLLEAWVEEKRELQPAGMVFAPLVREENQNPEAPLAPLLEKVLGSLRGETLQATCFVSSLADAPVLLRRLTQAFPQAAVSLVQPQRAFARASVACETISRATAVLPGTPPSLLVTGAQLGFQQQEGDVRLAFERLRKTVGAGLMHTVSIHCYPLPVGVEPLVRQVEPQFVNMLPVMIPVEGLPSVDASFAVEVIATP